MKLTRKAFVKGAGAGAGALAATRFLPGGLETLGRSGTEPSPEAVDEWVPAACWIGKQDCGMLARRVNGRVVKFVRTRGVFTRFGS